MYELYPNKVFIFFSTDFIFLREGGERERNNYVRERDTDSLPPIQVCAHALESNLRAFGVRTDALTIEKHQQGKFLKQNKTLTLEGRLAPAG